MAKDEDWVDIHTTPQEEWQKKKSEEMRERWKAEAEGRICPICDDIGVIETRDEKHYYHAPFGGGNTFTLIEHIQEFKCPHCGYTKEIKRWKEKDLFEKFIDWIKGWFD